MGANRYAHLFRRAHKAKEKGVKGNFKQGNKTIFQAVNILFVLNRTRARSLCVPTFKYTYQMMQWLAAYT